MTTAALDEVIHPLPRLSMCAVLSAVDWAAFAEVRDRAGLSDSALSKHARALEDAGYVEIRKGAIGRRPRTWLRLSEAGRVAFTRHMDALARIGSGTSSVAEARMSPPG